MRDAEAGRTVSAGGFLWIIETPTCCVGRRGARVRIRFLPLGGSGPVLGLGFCMTVSCGGCVSGREAGLRGLAGCGKLERLSFGKLWRVRGASGP